MTEENTDDDEQDVFVPAPEFGEFPYCGEKIVIGDKREFALEFDFDEFFDDEFIAWGTYRIYLNGRCYGRKSPHSWFCLVVPAFEKILEPDFKYDRFFNEYSDRTIAENYIKFRRGSCRFIDGKWVSTTDRKKYLGVYGKDMYDLFFDMGDSSNSEAHFDDGSNILVFCNSKIVKVLGFYDSRRGKIRNLNSVRLPREKFNGIIRAGLEAILSERSKAIHGKKTEQHL